MQFSGHPKHVSYPCSIPHAANSGSANKTKVEFQALLLPCSYYLVML